MPITTGAIRKQRADKRKAAVNLRVRNQVRAAVSAMRKKPTAKNLTTVFKALDMAAKDKVIHQNKAARLKSRLSHLVKRK